MEYRKLSPKLAQLGSELVIANWEEELFTVGIPKAVEYVEEQSKDDDKLKGEAKRELVVRALRFAVDNFVDNSATREKLFELIDVLVPFMVDLVVKANNAGIWKKSKWKQLAKKLNCCCKF